MPLVTFTRTIKKPSINTEVYHVIDSQGAVHALTLNANGVGNLDIPLGPTTLSFLLVGSNHAKVEMAISGLSGASVTHNVKIHQNNRIFTIRKFVV